ncbi:hypothetical protein BD324DRAFT_624111 [Kockovaella imperatae]|uniref:NAD(P)-binding domain-containing protein n=1 Tax=Kockovaella imperatae TaxID=4999 RepID=A0A1Y1UIY6_9TREE|nr:hypothetical protein BD324DRAFT_624111 [Kockovaella imperatae]ORX38001.1 hypothetical protein BD324DRAFT_624111 [Kockovaella imperatae]
MTTPTPVTLIGATGLTGSATLQSLLRSSHPFAITTIARKAIPSQTASSTQTTFTHTIVSDLFDAPNSPVGTSGGVYVSCLGTTRAQAGSLKEQEKIDVHLNRDLAKRAKADGCDTLILVSSAGTSADSYFPYGRMKGTLENLVKEMDFKSCVILRPGLLMGSRQDSRLAERTTQLLFRGLGSIGLPMGKLSAEATDIGQCIAHVAAHPPSEKVTILGNDDIPRLAKLWREENPDTTKQ